MPNTIPTEIIYDESVFLTRPRQGLRTWKAIAAGTITEMYLWADGATTGTHRFNVRKNGVNLFSNADRFPITGGSLDESKTGLSIPVAIGDTIALDYVQRQGSGRVLTPITFLMLTEEGV